MDIEVNLEKVYGEIMPELRPNHFIKDEDVHFLCYDLETSYYNISYKGNISKRKALKAIKDYDESQANK